MLKFMGKSKAASFRNNGSEGQRIVAYYVFNDGIQIMNTFEMNRFASLTYGERVCTEIYDMLESVLNMPEEFSILTLQKVLTLFQHLLTHGSDRCVELSMNMGHLIERMKKYNTAISTQRVSFFAQLKGGAVDQAFVVRQMASDLCKLLKDKPQISKLRMDNLDPNSLVPVGTGNQVGFAPTPSTAQEWMEEQRRKENRPRSNLKNADSAGFGGGCHIDDGDEEDEFRKSKVISAAHSLEEMMAKAREEEAKKKNRYFDDPDKAKKWSDKVTRESGLDAAEEILKEQFQQQMDLLGISSPSTVTTTSGFSMTSTAIYTSHNHPGADLLDFMSMGNEINMGTDLIGAGSAAEVDLLGYSGNNNDTQDLLFGGVAAPDKVTSNSKNEEDPFMDLLSSPIVHVPVNDRHIPSPIPIKPSIVGGGANAQLASALEMLDMSLPPPMPPPPPPQLQNDEPPSLPPMPPPPPPPQARDHTLSSSYPTLSMTPVRTKLPEPKDTPTHSQTSNFSMTSLKDYVELQQQEIAQIQQKIITAGPSMDPFQMMQLMQQQQERMNQLMQHMASMSMTQLSASSNELPSPKEFFVNPQKSDSETNPIISDSVNPSVGLDMSNGQIENKRLATYSNNITEQVSATSFTPASQEPNQKILESAPPLNVNPGLDGIGDLNFGGPMGGMLYMGAMGDFDNSDGVMGGSTSGIVVNPRFTSSAL